MDTKKTEQAQHSKRTSEILRSNKVLTMRKVQKNRIRRTCICQTDRGQSRSSRKNNVRKLRMERMMSKAELARRAGLSTLTVDRVEKGMPCRMDTKRKILEALGLRLPTG